MPARRRSKRLSKRLSRKRSNRSVRRKSGRVFSGGKLFEIACIADGENWWRFSDVDRDCSNCKGNENSLMSQQDNVHRPLPGKKTAIADPQNNAWMHLVRAKTDAEGDEAKHLLYEDKTLIIDTPPGRAGCATEVLTLVLQRTGLNTLFCHDCFFPMEDFECWDGKSLVDRPFVGFRYDKNLLGTPDSVKIRLQIRNYKLCAVMFGIEGHFWTVVRTSSGTWLNLDDNLQGTTATTDIHDNSSHQVSFLVFTTIQEDHLPSDNAYFPLTRRRVENSCFLNASVHIFKLIWLCYTSGILEKVSETYGGGPG